MSGCEWDPKGERSRLHGEESHAPAVFAVRQGEWHLCAECAALPLFSKFKKRPLREGAPSRAEGETLTREEIEESLRKSVPDAQELNRKLGKVFER